MNPDTDTASVLSRPPAAPTETPIAIGLRYGLLTALVWVIVDVVLRLTGLSFKVFSVYLPMSFLVIIGGIVLAQRQYKSQHRYLSWQQGFIIGLIVMLITSFVAQVFAWTYVNFIDPDYAARMRADVQAWMESFGNIPPEKLDEAMENMSDANVKSFSKIMTNSSIGIVVSSILISALVALFTKHQPAEFE